MIQFTQPYRTHPSALLNVQKALAEAAKLVLPKPPLTGSEWALRHRRLSAEGGQEQKFTFRKAPYAREPLDCATSAQNIRQVTLMWASGMAKTQSIIENTIGYYIEYEPSKIMVAFPTDKLAENWSKLHLTSLIRDTSVLKKLIDIGKVHTAGSEIQLKLFLGGFIIVVATVSGKGYIMYSIDVAIGDEIDSWVPTAGQLGNPLQLLRERIRDPKAGKLLIASKPVLREYSKIEENFLQSDQRFYFVPCPHCKFEQVLLFSDKSVFAKKLPHGFLLYNEANLSWVHYQCGNCKKPIEEKYKAAMCAEGKWKPQNPSVTDHAGFQINALYSQLGTSWTQIAKEFLTARQTRDQNDLQVCINSRFAETYSEIGHIELSLDELAQRTEEYTAVPDEVLEIVCAVDVQQNRLEVRTWGFGLGEEMWLLDKRQIIGNPEELNGGQTEKMLDAYIFQSKFKHANGVEKIINLTVIDGGAYSEYVHRYAKRRKGRVIVSLGRGGWKKEVVSVVKKSKYSSHYIIIGVDVVKKRMLSRLYMNRPSAETPKPWNGYIHLNKLCDLEEWKQYNAEALRPKQKRGYVTLIWEKKSGMENHGLDCLGYAYAGHLVMNNPLEAWSGRQKEIFEKKSAVGGPEGAEPNNPEGKQHLVKKISRSNKWSGWKV